jgi:NAD(P)-dependent dehydrogenase (short-subunit alcohol dehydrogenase family)
MMPVFDFSGQNILVTGASRGIGKAIATKFADSGGNVTIHYHKNRKAAEEVFSLLKPNHHTIIQADLSDPNEVENLSRQCFEKHKRIDVLVNNAGVFEESDIMGLSYENWQKNWQKTIDTNLSGAANLSFLISRVMKDKGGCKIINISSRGAFRGEPDAPAYGASKAGMNSLGQSLARALARYNIMVYTVAPGFVATEMAEYAMVGPRAEEIRNQSPLSRIAQPEEIAQTVLFLASPGTDYLTGCIIDINGASYLRT